MTLTIKLMAILAYASLSVSSPLKVYKDDAPLETSDSYQLYKPQLPLALELPKEEQNPVSFLAPEPETLLKAPKESQEPDFYQVPIPDQELIAPKDTEWNPENDPNYFYEVPSIITKQELPTQEFPKKYNKNVHQKDKPYSLKPKQVVIFEPIDEKLYDEKQKQLEKTFDKLAKKENQKNIIKAEQTF